MGVLSWLSKETPSWESFAGLEFYFGPFFWGGLFFWPSRPVIYTRCRLNVSPRCGAAPHFPHKMLAACVSCCGAVFAARWRLSFTLVAVVVVVVVVVVRVVVVLVEAENVM